jgi:hypothetical protein
MELTVLNEYIDVLNIFSCSQMINMHFGAMLQNKLSL